ncbi:MAG: RsmB/NOP family class I SAM-dependent RNA methyltransferase, partial [Alphaproteobacteria bacterium]|nr:RsmB/NOP family class I SAM-dependent RNA methyltransferase [Alphaproteobacteria bacterium]
DPSMPDPARLEYPAWAGGLLESAFGPRLAEEMAALNRQAPLDLRVNIARTTREAAREALAEERIETEPTPLSPWGLRVRGAARVAETAAFKKGLIEIQDEGSQIAALLVDVRPGMTAVDYCAGAGGKTLALAAMMSEKGRLNGRLVACDASAERLERMAPRLARAGAGTIECMSPNMVREQMSGRADRVLLDVPCSGSGAWRRDPLAKWRLSPETLSELRARQRQILAEGAALVRPGGRLAYVTCSVLGPENEDIVLAFAKDRNDFRVLPVGRADPEYLGVEVEEGNQFLRLTTARNGTDGFFIALLERVSA